MLVVNQGAKQLFLSLYGTRYTELDMSLHAVKISLVPRLRVPRNTDHDVGATIGTFESTPKWLLHVPR